MSVLWNVLNGFSEQADPRTKDWFLVGSPWPVIILIYVYVKFSTDWGPKWMKNRPPFQIDRIVQIYDIFQVLINAYMAYQAVIKWWDYNWQCEPVDYSNTPDGLWVAKVIHLYFMVKIVDLLDTVFFVLRKTENKITFLHVYHHASMVILIWVGIRFLPGGHATFIGLLNTIIHTFMYAHYFVMSLKIWKPWWKKYLTQMQILQFVLALFHFCQLWWVEDCGFPKSVGLLVIPQQSMMIWMFSKFYYHTYIKPSKETNQINGSAKTKNGKPKKYS